MELKFQQNIGIMKKEGDANIKQLIKKIKY